MKEKRGKLLDNHVFLSPFQFFGLDIQHRQQTLHLHVGCALWIVGELEIGRGRVFLLFFVWTAWNVRFYPFCEGWFLQFLSIHVHIHIHVGFLVFLLIHVHINVNVGFFAFLIGIHIHIDFGFRLLADVHVNIDVVAFFGRFLVLGFFRFLFLLFAGI